MLKVTLWKFRGNSLDSQNSWANGISESAIKSAVEKVILAMHRTFVKKYLRPPTRREAKKEALAFHNISGYPPIPYAAMDGCQIPVQFILKYICIFTAWMVKIVVNLGWLSLLLSKKCLTTQNYKSFF